eukprot:TRINITY_DN9112_c0_g1_i1.p3 TRINITY_DN9112_c0_g1~~TRINITY_DN9112_c0_g1_i1.p3  ORF type:complete len:127 (-),score=33.23 TRINITY_DN9112_c0_g1_i1:972-1352(-)
MVLNERTRVQQSKRRMAELQTKLLNFPTPEILIENPARKLEQEDSWTYAEEVSFKKNKKNYDMKVSERKLQAVRSFVFSDIIVIAKALQDGYFKYLFSIPLMGAILSTQKRTEGIQSSSSSCHAVA